VKNKITIVVLLLFAFGFKPEVHPNEKDILFFLEEYCNDFYPEHDINELIFISIKQQKLYLIRHGHVVSTHIISTSKYGLGNKQFSKKTPTGLHAIAHKIGKGVPLRGIIKGGVYTGKEADLEHYPVHAKGDFVTTRLLWLRGLEQGINAGEKIDTYDRRIYIHGTPEEGLIGKPSSHGCIRMTNYEVVELFKLVEKGLKVLILNV